MEVYVSGAVEGTVDGAVFERLLAVTKGRLAHLFITDGKGKLLNRLRGYNEAARRDPWMVLVDLDHDADCAPTFRATHLARPARHMAFRVVVRELEAWLLADRARIAKFLKTDLGRVPADPEQVVDPKRVIVDLARRSRSREIRRDLVPRPESGRTVGPLYVSYMTEFILDPTSGWRPRVAAESSDSLSRCIRDLERLVRGSRSRERQ